MKHHLYHALLALVGFGLFTSAALAAPKANIKERGSSTLEVLLEPTEGAAIAFAATATISIEKPKLREPAASIFTLPTNGLLAGDYGVDAALAGSDIPVHLGDFSVAPVATVEPTANPRVSFTISAMVNAALIESLSVTDASGTVILEGAAVTGSVNWKYFANVRVTAGDLALGAKKAKGPKIRGASGHVLSKSTVTDDVETKRQFLWVAFGAPADVELTVNVDGTEVGTVTSTAHGKVMFRELPEEVDLRNVQLITLCDDTGAVVMQARF